MIVLLYLLLMLCNFTDPVLKEAAMNAAGLNVTPSLPSGQPNLNPLPPYHYTMIASNI